MCVGHSNHNYVRTREVETFADRVPTGSVKTFWAAYACPRISLRFPFTMCMQTLTESFYLVCGRREYTSQAVVQNRRLQLERASAHASISTEIDKISRKSDNLDHPDFSGEGVQRGPF